MDVRFITDLSHRDSANQYRSNEVCFASNARDDEIAYHERKNQAIQNMIKKVLEELNSPDELTEDKKKQLTQTLTTAHEYLKVSWHRSADYRWLNYSRWIRF